MSTKPLVAALVGFALTTGGVYAQDADVSPPTQDEMRAAMTTPDGFAERAASSNMFEIQSSQLALEKSQSQEVIAFAQHMIKDHEAAGEKMVTAATSEGLTKVSVLMPDHQAQLNNLAANAPEDFDAAYLGAQLAAHTEAVALFEGYSTSGPEGALKTFATETLPTLKKHLDEVKPLSEI